ncbi:MAG: hypothetical protein IPM53_18200 [Anaerolineaceae bacterium]|nr:hypothetical protein [Anaerolineaceae bacterium]
MTSEKNSRYFVWRFSNNDDPGDQLQKGIQEYIKRYQSNPSLVLVPQGLELLPPIGNLEIRQDVLVLPFRYYFQVEDS